MFAVGEVVEIDDAEALANAIVKLVHLPEDEYQTLSEKAVAVAHQYSWKKIVKERINYYQIVMDRNNLGT